MGNKFLLTLAIVGLAASANANNVSGNTTSAGQKALNAVGDDLTSSGQNTGTSANRAAGAVSGSQSLASLKSSVSSVYNRISDSVSSKASPVQKGDAESSSKGTTNGGKAVAGDVSSTGEKLGQSSKDGSQSTGNSQISATGTSAAKKAGKAVEGSVTSTGNAVKKVAGVLWEGLLKPSANLSAGTSTAAGHAVGGSYDAGVGAVSASSNAGKEKNAAASSAGTLNASKNGVSGSYNASAASSGESSQASGASSAASQNAFSSKKQGEVAMQEQFNVQFQRYSKASRYSYDADLAKNNLREIVKTAFVNEAPEFNTADLNDEVFAAVFSEINSKAQAL